MGIGEYFGSCLVVDQIFNNNNDNNDHNNNNNCYNNNSKCRTFSGQSPAGRVGVRTGFGSKVVFWACCVFLPPRITAGSARGPNQLPRFQYFILDNSSELR